jgi:hypothetical protein
MSNFITIPQLIVPIPQLFVPNQLPQDEYRIKIPCTREGELTFKNKQINKNTQIPEIIKNIDFINPNNIRLIIKTNKEKNNEEIKTLEFMCTRELNDRDILYFIYVMKKNEFKSTKNVYFKYCKNHHENIIKYKFTTLDILITNNTTNYNINSSSYTTFKL